LVFGVIGPVLDTATTRRTGRGEHLEGGALSAKIPHLVVADSKERRDVFSAGPKSRVMPIASLMRRSNHFERTDYLTVNVQPGWTIRHEGEQTSRGISIVVPVRDEQETLLLLVDAIRSTFVAQGKTDVVEVILVDDGSRDDTWKVVQR
jgi:hypothetical protein